MHPCAQRPSAPRRRRAGHLRGREFARQLEVLVRQGVHAGLALDGLEHDGRKVIALQRHAARRGRLRGTNWTPAGSGSNGARIASLPVSASAPIERPWNEPSSATILVRPVLRAILKTASMASVPLVGEEDARAGRSVGQLRESLRERNLRLRCEEVGRLRERCRLARDRLHPTGVRVAKRSHGDAAKQVKVAVAVRVPHVGALAASEHALRASPKVAMMDVS